MKTTEERLTEIEIEVQALMAEMETQKLVNAELSSELRDIRKALGAQTTADKWADLGKKHHG